MNDDVHSLYERIRRFMGLLTSDPNMDAADVEAVFEDSVQHPEAYFGVLVPDYDDPMDEVCFCDDDD